MAVTLGGVASALASFSGGDQAGQLISSETVDFVTCVYAPLSILIMVYALFTYEWRSMSLKKKLVCAFLELLIRSTPTCVCVGCNSGGHWCVLSLNCSYTALPHVSVWDVAVWGTGVCLP